MVDGGFLQPLWLLLLPLPFVWLYFRYRSHGSWPALVPLVAIKYPLLQSLQTSAEPSQTGAGNHYADKLLTVAMCLMLFALAQPVHYKGDIEVAAESEPVDLVLVVGTAVSMTLRDYVIDQQRVDRMSLTRRLLDDFVADYSGRRIGLVILGNPPMLWMPFTDDKRAVRDAIGRIRTTLGGRLTDMGATLQLVGENFIESKDAVVVVVTDGGLQLGATSPRVAAGQLADLGFSTYVIGIGSTDPDAGEHVGGGLIYEPIELAPLQQLAEIGGGKLFHVADAGAFRDALDFIEDKHRKPQPAVATERLIAPWSWLPLMIALLLLLIGVRVGTSGARGS